MGKVNNFPQAGLENLEADFIEITITNLKQLADMGKPRTDEEVAERIDKYFSFCQRTKCRPGIEGLCLALDISRTTLFNWNQGAGCSEYRAELIGQAKRFILAFLEQANLQGKLNPASSIFLLKNWAGYRDSVSIEPPPVSAGRVPSLSRNDLLVEEPFDIPELPD